MGALWAVLTPQSRDQSLEIRLVRVSILLGGQRAQQLHRCTQASVDIDDTSSITLLDGKGRRPEPRLHGLPIPPAAKVEIEWLLQHSKSLGSTFLFPGRSPDKPLTDGPISRAVHQISSELVASGICIPSPTSSPSALECELLSACSLPMPSSRLAEARNTSWGGDLRDECRLQSFPTLAGRQRTAVRHRVIEHLLNHDVRDGVRALRATAYSGPIEIRQDTSSQAIRLHPSATSHARFARTTQWR